MSLAHQVGELTAEIAADLLTGIRGATVSRRTKNSLQVVVYRTEAVPGGSEILLFVNA